MPANNKALLPPSKDLADLTDAKVESVCRTVDLEGQRTHRYAVQALWAGVVCFLSCVGGFGYLVQDNSPKAAAALLGSAVVGVVVKIFSQRQ
jgi:hypothetical protein